MSESNVGKTRLTTSRALPSGGNEHAEKPTGLAALSGARPVPAHTPAHVDAERPVRADLTLQDLAGLLKGSFRQSATAKADELFSHLPNDAKSEHCLHNLKLAIEARGDDVRDLLHIGKKAIDDTALRMQIRTEVLYVLAHSGRVEEAMRHKEYLFAREDAVRALTGVITHHTFGRSARAKANAIVSKLDARFDNTKSLRAIRSVIENNDREGIVGLLHQENGGGLSAERRDEIRAFAIQGLLKEQSLTDIECNMSRRKKIMKVEDLVIGVLGEADGREVIRDLQDKYRATPDKWFALEKQLLKKSEDVEEIAQCLQRDVADDAELRFALLLDCLDAIRRGRSIETVERRTFSAAACTEKIAAIVEDTPYDCSGKSLKGVYDAFKAAGFPRKQIELMLKNAMAEASLCKEYLAITHEQAQQQPIADDQRAADIVEAVKFFTDAPTPKFLRPTILTDGQEAPGGAQGRAFDPKVFDYQYQRKTTAVKVATLLNEAVNGKIDLQAAGVGMLQAANGRDMLSATNVADSQGVVIFWDYPFEPALGFLINADKPISPGFVGLNPARSRPTTYSVNWIMTEPAGVDADRIAKSNRRTEIDLRRFSGLIGAQSFNIIRHSHAPVADRKDLDNAGRDPQPLSIIVNVKDATISIMPVASHFSNSRYGSAVVSLPKDQAELDTWRSKPLERKPDMAPAQLAMRAARARQAQGVQSKGALNEAPRPNDSVQDAPFLAPPVLNKRSTGNMSTVIPEAATHAPNRNAPIQEEAPEDTLLTLDELRELNIAPPPGWGQSTGVDEAPPLGRDQSTNVDEAPPPEKDQSTDVGKVPSQTPERKDKSDFISPETEL